MEDHLGYEKSCRSENDDYRNGYKPKTVKSSIGEIELKIPQDRKSTFEQKVVKKSQKDISDIDQKIISMYAKGMTTRQYIKNKILKEWLMSEEKVFKEFVVKGEKISKWVTKTEETE